MITNNSTNEWEPVYRPSVSSGIKDWQDDSLFPNRIKLFQNYPNPFNPSTTIRYEIPERSFVTIKVYDVLGNEIATLVNEEKPTGSYEVEFRPESSIQQLASGIYFYELTAGLFIQTKKCYCSNKAAHNNYHIN